MNEIDQLAAGLVVAAERIIVLPLKIAVWVARAALRSLKKLGSGVSGRWNQRRLRKSRATAAKSVGSALDKKKLKYEMTPIKKWWKNGAKHNRK